MKIVAECRDDTPYRKMLTKNLVAYNDQNGPLEHWQYVGFYALNDQEELIGGVQGNFEWDWLHITHLWVKTPQNGLGSELIKKIEDYSKQQGKTGVFLDTLGFQAKAFYEKQGYTLLATIENTAGPYARYFLTKRFD